MKSNEIFITGATGFVGSALLNSLVKTNASLFVPVRDSFHTFSTNTTKLFISDISDLPSALLQVRSIDTVIHIAAKAHVVGVSLDEFRRVNTEPTLELAKISAAKGVRRFIFLSSVGVNGIKNTVPFSVFDKPSPVENYAVSKLEAEVGLRQIAEDTGMEVVIIRPPLVYGPNAPGNFGKLINLAKKNLPLPLGAIHNKRSFVSLINLVDLIETCIYHPNAANQTFLVSDDQDLATTELLTLLTRAAGKKPRLLPVPVSWLNAIGKLTGKQAIIDRLCGNLQVDISHTKNTLGWRPPISVEEGIRRCFDTNA